MTDGGRKAAVWVATYWQELRRFAASGMHDLDAFDAITASVRTLFERVPSQNRAVLRLAIRTSLMTRRAVDPDRMRALVHVGLEAAMVEGAELHVSETALLILSMAETELHAEHRLAGLRALEDLGARADAGQQPVLTWIRVRERYLRGRLYAIGLDRTKARASFADALASARGILEDPQKVSAFSEQWLEIVIGGETHLSDTDRQGFLLTARLELEQACVGAAVGVASLMAPDSSDAARANAARDAWSALNAWSAPPDLSAFDLVGVVGALPLAEARRFARWLVKEPPGSLRAADRGPLFAAITDPAARSLVEAAEREMAQREALGRVTWDVAGRLGIAEAAARSGDGKTASRTRTRAVDAAMRGRLAMPIAAALGAQLVAEKDAGSNDLDRLSDLFLAVLGSAIEADQRVFGAPSVLSLLDRAIGIAAASTADRAGAAGQAGRRAASVALDLLRSRRPPAVDALTVGRGEPESPAAEGILQASDSLGRIRATLRHRKGVAAVILHGQGPGTGWLVLGPRRSVTVKPDDGMFARVVGALVQCADDAVRDLAAGDQTAGARLVACGRSAYEALPPQARKAIDSAEVLLLAPDLRSDQDEIPFELFHDGKGFLGDTRILARFTSLHHMASVLDTRRGGPRWKRAVVAAVAETLPAAERERADVVRLLTEHGYDAPSIDEKRLSASFVTDRLGWIDVFHIAAHGLTAAESEALVLPDGDYLVVDDLLRRPQRSMPLVYLDTCRLAKTRYLGGGLSRGLAYTFGELGAPTVIAHTVDVYDEVAAEIARRFYDAAMRLPVGAALREARRSLGDVLPAPVRCRALLFGDPWHTLPGVDASGSRPDPAADLLDAYFTPGVQDDRRVRAGLEARRALEADGDQPRLLAAFAFLRSVEALGTEVAEADIPDLERTIELADALEHLPSMGMTRLIGADALKDLDDDRSAAMFEEAARYLWPLAESDKAWQPFLDAARAGLGRHRRDASGLTLEVTGPATEADRRLFEGLDEVFLAAATAAHEQQEDRP